MAVLRRHRNDVTACLGIVLIFALLFALSGEQIRNFDGGNGSYTLEISEGETVVQEFRPRHSQLQRIGFLLSELPERMEDTYIDISIEDDAGNEVYQTHVLYGREGSFGDYYEVDLPVRLRAWKKYALLLNFSMQGTEEPIHLLVCSADDRAVKECGWLYVGEERIQNTRILMDFLYESAISPETGIKIWLLCLITLFLACFPFPAQKKIRITGGVFVAVFIPFVIGRYYEYICARYTSIYPPNGFLLPMAIWWNIGLLFLVEGLMVLLTNSLSVGGTVFVLATTILYSADYYVYKFRSIPLRVSDLTIAKTAFSVVEKYDLYPGSALGIGWALSITLFVATRAFRMGRERKKHIGKNVLSIALTGLLSIGLYCFSTYTDFFEQMGFVFYSGINHYATYEFDGYLVGTLVTIKNSRIAVPDGYTRAKAESVLSAIDRTLEQDINSDDDFPHIFLILDESFTDLRILSSSLKLSEENLICFNGLQKNVIRGVVHVSVYAGNTADSEYELLTGFPLAFLPENPCPFERFITMELDSLPAYLSDIGYATYAIHPCPSTNYARGYVYPLLGFQNMIWLEDFEGAEEQYAGISDRATFQKVEEIYAQRKDGEKLFIYDLTIQNHGGYSGIPEDAVMVSDFQNNDGVSDYLTRIRETDIAFSEFIEWCQKQDEKILVCMTGDHHPGLPDNFYEEILQNDTSLSVEELTLAKYENPFVIWANYDLNVTPDMEIGMSYLGMMLMKVAKLPLPRFYHYQEKMMEIYPSVSTSGYLDASGRLHPLSEMDETLAGYQILEYNYLFDGNTIHLGYE